jgi:4-amino-4-deoxy-L-arabinose transferase-like glycosyltransferase
MNLSSSPATPTSNRNSRPHFFAFAAIILLAVLLRFWDLSGLPSGVHGDEGIVGYEARRILREGSIGPFSPASFGQPSGPIYFCAITEFLMGETILAIRSVSALAGVLAVVALYFLIRPDFGRRTALVGAFVLATLTWHIHFARIAFPLECWPLICIFIAWAAVKALKNLHWKWWAFAGFVNGLGVYAYKAHPLFFLIVAGFVAIQLLRTSIPIRTKIGYIGLYGLSVVVAANFLIRYALAPQHRYNSHFSLYSVFNSEHYLALESTLSRFWYLIMRYLNWWNNAVFSPQLDSGDGAGIVPLISVPVFLLFLVGVLAPKKYFNQHQWNLISLSKLIVILMPISSVITVEAFARRTFALAPFLCLLAATGAFYLLQVANQKRGFFKAWTPSCVALLLLVGAIQSGRDYFSTFRNHPKMPWVFCQELTDSLHYIKSLPAQTPIFFYSERWSINYDTRKFLAPDLNALDLSKEFSGQGETISPLSYEINPGKKNVWVFLKPYEKELEIVKTLYPNGKVIRGPYFESSQGPSFMAYEIN